MSAHDEARPGILKLFAFFELCGRLKHIRRTGWVNRGVKDPEDVAGHMYRMAMMSFLLVPDGGNQLSREKCIKMCLVHDLAESIVGDITPSDGISKDKKFQLEKEAMKHIMTLVPNEVGQELFDLWEEYEDAKTPEAKVVKDLDKFDMIFQAYEYEKAENSPGRLEEFFSSTKGKFTHPEITKWVAELEQTRKGHFTDELDTKPDPHN